MEPQVDAVVIGAGLSGLTAAQRLVERGASVRVLEARDRVGGRTFSQTLGKSVIDLGGQWVGATQERVLRLAHELGIQTFPQYTHGKKVIELNGRRRTYAGLLPNLPLFPLLETGWTFFRLGRLSRTIPLEHPLAAKRAAAWDGMSAAEWMRHHIRSRDARSLFETAIHALVCAEPREISFLYLLHYIRSAGGLVQLTSAQRGAQHYRLLGGAQQLSTKLAERLAGCVQLQ